MTTKILLFYQPNPNEISLVLYHNRTPTIKKCNIKYLEIGNDVLTCTSLIQPKTSNKRLVYWGPLSPKDRRSTRNKFSSPTLRSWFSIDNQTNPKEKVTENCHDSVRNRRSPPLLLCSLCIRFRQPGPHRRCSPVTFRSVEIFPNSWCC